MRDSRDPFPHMAERSDGRHRALGNGVSHARAPLVKSNRPSRRSAPFASPSRWREGEEGRSRSRSERGRAFYSVLSPISLPFFGGGGVAGHAQSDQSQESVRKSVSRSVGS